MKQLLNKTPRTCLQYDHLKINCSHLCTFEECENIWLCGECIRNKIHQHQQSKDNHIMNEKQFKDYITRQTEELMKNRSTQTEFFDNCVIQLDNIMKQIINLKSQMQQELMNNLEIMELESIEEILKQANDDFLLVDKQQVELLAKVSRTKINHHKTLQITSQIKKYIAEFELSIQNEQFKTLQVQINQKLQAEQVNLIDINLQINLQNMNLISFQEYYKYSQDQKITTIQISHNEEHVAYGVQNKNVNIVDLKQQQNIQQIKLHFDPTICKFSNNSLLLYVGDESGILYCYKVGSLERLFKSITHQLGITNIISIENHLILTGSLDQSIIITDMRKNKFLVNIHNAHDDNIYGLAYDKTQNIIISSSKDKSIKLFKAKDGQQVMQKENAHQLDIIQIQLKSSHSLLSCSKYQLKLWQIDYKNSVLLQIIIHQIKDEIYNFSLVNENKLILVTKKDLSILNEKFEQTFTTKHNVEDIQEPYMTQQIGTMNQIIILGINQFQILQKIQ